MSITSFSFLCCFLVLLLLYYLVPKRMQWGLLLLASIGFILESGEPWLLIYPVLTIGIVYGGALYIQKAKEQKQRKTALLLIVVLCVSFLCVLKYFHLGLLAPLGISFYTLTLLGYVFDVYYEIGEAETNILRLALFGYYFPTMISGPIMQYQEMKHQLYTGHALNYRNITFGMQRMLWGFFKKLVISERMAIIANEVFNHYETYSGFAIILGSVCFTFQLYTDFSGCMDIVLGISETFGILLPENFNAPFFARSITEYWRRWHITLGTWLRNYLFYPLLRTSFFTSLPKKWKQKLGKKRAKQAAVFLAMLILWFTIGYWHGGVWKYIIGSGLLHWCYIVSGELLEPLWIKLKQIFHVKEKNKLFICFQRIRTFVLVAIGLTFFRAENAATACRMLGRVFKSFNPWIFIDGTIPNMGLSYMELAIALVSLLMLLLVSMAQQKGSIRERLAAKPLVFRWVVLYALLFYVILLGNYGPGYSAAEFIYAGF